ncbi:hypothetical protein J6P92_03925 [bacterium]|nr:hypothetical protein [bacterium]
MVTFRPDDRGNQLDQMRDDFANRRKITKADRIRTGENQMTETAKNANGEIIKVSVFLDKNKDGKYTPNEVVSVTYNDVGSMSCGTTEYRDTDNDGYCDAIVTSDWTGNESVEKVPKRQQTKMDLKYGFKWDASEPVEPSIHMTPGVPLDKNGNPIHYEK